MKTATVHEAKTHLSKLLAEVEKGEEVVICRSSVPVARLSALRPTAKPRPRIGVITSAPIRCSDDCFEPLSDGELKDWGL